MIVGSAFLKMGVEMIACMMSLEWDSQPMIPTPIDSTMLIYIPTECSSVLSVRLYLLLFLPDMLKFVWLLN